MNTEYFPIDDGTQWQKIKCLIKIFPAIRIPIFFVDFIQETVHHCNISTLVVAS